MITLAIDTSFQTGFISLCQGTLLVFQKQLAVSYRHSQYLMETLHQAFEQEKISLKDLDLIVSCTGPGSYTGIRVGACVCQALSYALEIPMVGVCSLKGLVPEKEGYFASIMCARQNDLYAILGKKSHKSIEWISQARRISLSDLLAELPPSSSIITQEDLSFYDKMCALDASLKHFSWQQSSSDALYLNCLGQNLYEEEGPLLEKQLPLCYLRQTQAEYEKSKKN